MANICETRTLFRVSPCHVCWGKGFLLWPLSGGGLWGLLGTSLSRSMLEACKKTIFKPYESTSHIWMSEWKCSVIKCPNPSAKPPKIISRFASHNRSRRAKTAGMVFGVEKSKFPLYVTAFGKFFLKVEGNSTFPNPRQLFKCEKNAFNLRKTLLVDP